jgi:hypothetical protein
VHRFLIGLLLLAALVVSTGYVLLSPSVLGRLWESSRNGLTIDNRTSEPLHIFARRPDGSERAVAPVIPPIPPHAYFESDFLCAAGELVARNQRGELVARRGPFEECNLEPWVIEAH